MNSTEQPHEVEAKPSHAQIALLAYTFWEEGGHQPDRDLEYWLAAEQALKGNSHKGLKYNSSEPKLRAHAEPPRTAKGKRIAHAEVFHTRH